MRNRLSLHARAPKVAAAVVLASLCAQAGGFTRAASASHPATGEPLAVLVSGVGVGPNPGGSTPLTRYTVGLVDENGRAVASATAANRIDIPIFDAAPLNLPLVSVSRSRVYFIDQNEVVKSLAPDGTIQTVTRVPGGPRANVAIAVSPDDRRIAVGILTYKSFQTYAPQGGPGPVKPLLVTTRIYVEDLRGGHHVELFSSNSAYEWPVGWQNGNLVLAVSQEATTQATVGNPYSAFNGYHVVDATTGKRLSTLCTNPGDNPSGPLTSAGTLCVRANGGPYAVSWTGSARRLPGGPVSWDAALAADGESFANGSGPMFYAATTGSQSVAIWHADGTRTMTTVSGNPLGWIDSNHLVIAPSSNTGAYSMLDLRSSTTRVIGPYATPEPSADVPMAFFGVLHLAVQPIARTDVIIFHPTGTQGQEETGSCWSGSDAVWRPDAWRCTVEQTIYDPCFSSSPHATAVICNAYPWAPSGGFTLKLTSPLPLTLATKYRPHAWLFKLADGVICYAETGAGPAYGCSDGWVVRDDPHRGRVWTVTESLLSSDQSGALTSVTQSVHVSIRTVWM